jgi:hypothetical protein
MNRPARLNRTLLLLTGLPVLVAGLASLLVSLGAAPFPAPAPDTPVIPPGSGLQWWTPYLVAVLGAALAVACVGWLLAQARRTPAQRTWRLPGSDPRAGRTYLPAGVAADAVAQDILSYPGVTRAGAILTGHRAGPTLHLTVHTAAGTRVDALRARITAQALPRLRHALELDRLPADLLIHLDSGTGPSRLGAPLTSGNRR